MKPQTFTSFTAFLAAGLLALLTTESKAVNKPPESSLTITGNHVVVNDDDENDNHIPDKLENASKNLGLKRGAPPAYKHPPEPEPVLVEFKIKAIHVAGCTCELVIEKSSQFDTHVKLWKDAEKSGAFDLPEYREVYDADSGTIKFWVEGIEPTEAFNSLSIKATYTVTNDFGYDTAVSEIKFGVTRADIRVDSNNDTPAGATEPVINNEDDKIEFSDNPEQHGKIMLENTGDVDNDGLMDSLDGLGLANTGGSPGVANLKLVPMKVKLEKPYDPNRAKVTFKYHASNPRIDGTDPGIETDGPLTGGIQKYKIKSRGIRLWKVEVEADANGIERRNGNDVTNGGHFIPKDQPIPWTAIAAPETPGGPIPDEITLYLEYVDLPAGKTYSRENIVYKIKEEGVPEANKGYIKTHGIVNPAYLAEKESPDGLCVSLVPVEVVSRDRMIAGSIKLPDGWDEKLQLQFVHKDTGEDLGTYGNLLSKEQGAYLYDSDREMFNEAELAAYNSGSLDSRIRTEEVIFCKRAGEEDVVEFYTVFENVGDIEIKMILDGAEIGLIGHTLEQDSVFSSVIDYINDTVSNSPIDDGPILAARTLESLDLSERGAAPQAQDLGIGSAKIDILAKRALVPVFNGMGAWLGAQADSERLIVGLFDGVKQGVIDDWALLQLLGELGGELGGTAALQISDNLPGLLLQETQKWKDDPYKRASDIATIVHQVVENAIIGPLGGFGDNFTSWENFKKFSWGLFNNARNGAAIAWNITQDMTGAILNGLGGWYIDFCERMYEGAEKTVFSSVPFGPVDPWRQDLRTFYYTFGYTFGYLGEQVLLGKGIGAVAKGMAKIGGKVALSALPHVKRFTARVMPFVTKKWSSKVITTADNDAWTAALRETQTEALEQQTRNGIPISNDKLKPVAESIDEAMEKEIANFHGKLIQEEIDALPRLKGAVARKAVLSRLGILSKLMGDRLDDAAAKNFVKIYERKLLLDPANGDDLFNDWIVATHSKFIGGQSPLLDQLVSANSTLDRLEKFLKPPNEFSPWKAGFETADDFGNTARGRLLQVHEGHHGVFKNWDNLDVIDEDGIVRHSKALDFQSKVDPGVFAEMKTTAAADPSFLREALDRSAREAQARSGHTLEFHVYYLETNPKPDLASLLNKAAELEGEFPGFIVKIIDTPSPFQHWN